jgi:MerR family mercuric resistance operon transcriptional regulator
MKARSAAPRDLPGESEGDETFTIGELARRAGVNVQTVRYYERRGLLDEPERRDSGYRVYHTSVLQRLRFIRRAQELGFTLGEIGELLQLRLEHTTTAGAVKQRAERKIAEIDGKLRDLTRIRNALTHLAGRCHGGRGPTGDCPLLEALGPLGDDADTH